MIKEVSRFSDLPASNDPDLEVGDVYRVTDGRLNPSGTVLKWDGRAWVPLRDVEPVQNKSGGKKDDVNAVGAAPDGDMDVSDGGVDAMRCRVTDGLTNGHKIVYPYDNALGAGECYYCGGHDFDDPCWYGPTLPVGNVTDVGVWGEKEPVRQVRVDDPDWVGVGHGRLRSVDRVMKRHDIQALDADSDVISRWMPRDLVTWYVALCGRITGPSGSGMDDTVIPGTGKPYGGLGSLTSSSSSSLKPDSGKRGQKSSVLMRSEWASLLKERTDRKLRKIARELKNALDEDDELRMDAASKGAGGKNGRVRGMAAPRRRCSGKCGKFGESDWLYCARCGGPMNEVD